MAQSQQNTNYTALEHAMHAGLELGVLFVVTFILDCQSRNYGWLSILSYLVVFLIVYFVYFAAQIYKETKCGGSITYRGAFRYINYLVMCASLVAALLRYVYLRWIDPSLLGYVYETTLPIVKEALPEVGEEQIAALQTLFNPIRFALYYVIYDLFIGVLIGLIMAAMVSRRKMNVPRDMPGDEE